MHYSFIEQLEATLTQNNELSKITIHGGIIILLVDNVYLQVIINANVSIQKACVGCYYNTAFCSKILGALYLE